MYTWESGWSFQLSFNDIRTCNEIVYIDTRVYNSVDTGIIRMSCASLREGQSFRRACELLPFGFI